MTRRARALAAIVVLAASAVSGPRASAAKRGARVVVLDDGEKVLPAEVQLDDSPWPAGPIELFALRDETLALQAVIDAGDEPVERAEVLVQAFTSSDGVRIPIVVENFVERFVVVGRPTGNDRSDDSLAFTSKSAPGSRFVGPVADPLVPDTFEVARAAPHERAAIRIDLHIPSDARPGVYRSTLVVRDALGELDARAIELRVLGADLPFAAAAAFVYYDSREIARRIGQWAAEPSLRRLLHAHHLGAVHDLTKETKDRRRQIEFDRTAILGTAYARAHGYEGPGQNVGEGVLALGAYGSLGAPSEAGRAVAEDLASQILEGRTRQRTAAFLYAIDEQCASDWPAEWMSLLDGVDSLRDVRVGETCGAEPSTLAASLVMQTGPDLDPARARVAASDEVGRRKWVWAYNGARPAAGPMMIDVPATDLRANAWIAMRYGVPRWFYWEATFWFDDNAGGLGGEVGFDPFTVAETFHNKSGDHANGDGILVYPGHQPKGMTDYKAPTLVFPSVRLKNLRRGIEDAGYIALARAIDPDRADAIVRQIVPRALAWAGDRPSWPQHGRPWLEARRQLAAIVAASEDPNDGGATGVAAEGANVSQGCGVSRSPPVSGALAPQALFCLWGIGLVLRGLGRAKLGAQTRHGNDRKTRRVAAHEAGAPARAHEQGGAEA